MCGGQQIPAEAKVYNVEWVHTLAEYAANLWGYAAILCGAAVRVWAAWKYLRDRVAYCVRAVDAIRLRYGDDAEGTVAWWHSRQKLIAIHEVRQRLLESHIGISIFVCDSDGACEYANDEIGELFGLDRAEFRGFGWLEGICPSDRERVHKTWLFCVSTKTPYECEYSVRNKRNGMLTECVAKAYPVVRDSGEVLCYVGMVHPIKASSNNSQ